MLTKGVEAWDTGIERLPNSSSLAQPHMSNPLSVKGKKVLARGFSQSKLPNTDRSSLRKLTSTKPTSLPPYHVSSPNHVPIDHSFKFKASSSGEREHQSSGSESQFSGVERENHSGQSVPRFSGDGQASHLRPDVNTTNDDGKIGESTNLNPISNDHGHSICGGNGDISVEEQSSPSSKDGSIYEDMDIDGIVSEGGDGVPPSGFSNFSWFSHEYYDLE